MLICVVQLVNRLAWCAYLKLSKLHNLCRARQKEYETTNGHRGSAPGNDGEEDGEMMER